jgi:hypothetical protein
MTPATTQARTAADEANDIADGIIPNMALAASTTNAERATMLSIRKAFRDAIAAALTVRDEELARMREELAKVKREVDEAESLALNYLVEFNGAKARAEAAEAELARVKAQADEWSVLFTREIKRRKATERQLEAAEARVLAARRAGREEAAKVADDYIAEKHRAWASVQGDPVQRATLWGAGEGALFVAQAIRALPDPVEAVAEPAEAWKPTHQHYKGGFYRVIARGRNENTLNPCVIYDNEAGDVWVRPADDFDQTDLFVRFAALPVPPRSPIAAKG